MKCTQRHYACRWRRSRPAKPQLRRQPHKHPDLLRHLSPLLLLLLLLLLPPPRQRQHRFHQLRNPPRRQRVLRPGMRKTKMLLARALAMSQGQDVEMAEEDESEEDAIKRAIEMSMKGNDDQQKK